MTFRYARSQQQQPSSLITEHEFDAGKNRILGGVVGVILHSKARRGRHDDTVKTVPVTELHGPRVHQSSSPKPKHGPTHLGWDFKDGGNGLVVSVHERTDFFGDILGYEDNGDVIAVREIAEGRLDFANWRLVGHREEV